MIGEVLLADGSVLTGVFTRESCGSYGHPIAQIKLDWGADILYECICLDRIIEVFFG